MTEKTILFRGGDAEVYADGDVYRDRNGMGFESIFFCKDYLSESSLIHFNAGSDIGLIDGEPLDILLQCLEHRLATRNLAEPVLERTNALDCLRNMRRWLAELENHQTADRERSAP